MAISDFVFHYVTQKNKDEKLAGRQTEQMNTEQTAGRQSIFMVLPCWVLGVTGPIAALLLVSTRHDKIHLLRPFL